MSSILGLTLACCSVACRVWSLTENTLKSKHCAVFSLPAGVAAMFRYYDYFIEMCFIVWFFGFFYEECDANISVSLRLGPFSLVSCTVYVGLILFPLLHWV